MKKTSLLLHLTTALALVLACWPQKSHALNDVLQNKLYGHWAASPASYGTSECALNEKWAVYSTANAAEQTSLQGAVQVYSATTGSWVRKYLPPGTATANTYFGNSLALSGDMLAVGAPGVASSTGAVYLYSLNLTSLTPVRTFTVTGATANDKLGISVAIHGNRLLAGAIGYNGFRGAVYVFDLNTGASIGRIDLSGAAVNDNFGASLAAASGRVLIGAPGKTNYAGAVYLYDINSLALIRTYSSAGVTTSDRLGSRVALTGNRVFASAPYRATQRGSVFSYTLYDANAFTEIIRSGGGSGEYFGYHLAADAGKLLVPAYGASNNSGVLNMYDVSDTTVNTATLVRTITANDSSSSLYFGYGLALCGNSALVGAYGDSTQASSAGAAYLMSPMITPNSGMTRIVSKGQFAPGAPDTTFNVLGEAYTNGFGAVAFTSSLTGLGSNANTDTGVWSTIKNPPGTLQLIAKARKPLAASGNQIYQSFGIPLFNEQNDLIVPCVMKLGTGTPAVTATTTKWFLNQSSGSSTPTVLLTNGSTPSVTAFNSSKIANFLETVQGNPSGQNYWANAVSLTVNAAYSTTAANDSGVIYANGTSNNFGYREGVDTIPGGGFFYGQFTGRVALPYATVLFSAATTGPVTNNQIVVVTPATSSTPVLAWQKGEAAPELGATPPTFSSIIGETLDGAPASTYVRATLTGGNPATTVLDNEGIWRRTSGGSKFLSLRKGQSIGSTGLSILKIITVSGGTYLNNGLLALVQLKGSTVNTTNDQAFIAVQEDSTAGAPNITILLREGDPVGGNGTGTIGVISRVAMESYSCFYMILATLAGAPVGTDQALYVGSTYGGNNSAQTPLRRPYLLMRKGWMYDGQPSKVKSMNFPITMQTASGFTATGRSNCMGWFKNYAITVEFENGMKQIMQGFVQ